MKSTGNAIRDLQRSLNALARGTCLRPLVVDGRPGRRTLAGLVRFVAAFGAEGEARLVRAMRALR